MAAPHRPDMPTSCISPPVGRYRISATSHRNGFHFDIPNIGDAYADAFGNLLEARLAPGGREDLLQDALTGHVLPLLWPLRGGFLLHAAAVATPAGAILFFGASGAGKSTLAASFENELGCWVLDDDSALLEDGQAGIRVHPTGRGVSLWEDSLAALGERFPQQRRLPAYGSKYRARRQCGVPPAEWPEVGSPGSVPLIAAFHLLRSAEDDPSSPICTPMTASDKHLRLARASPRLDITDQDYLKRQFRFLSRVIATVPICRLRFSRSYAVLPEVHQAVLGYLRKATAL